MSTAANNRFFREPQAIEPAVHIDWADDLAAQIIAAYCGKGFTEARKEIAERLRVVKATCQEAAMARIRQAGRRVSDAQFDYDLEQDGGAQ